jgi:ComEC/Rec2-related protein
MIIIGSNKVYTYLFILFSCLSTFLLGSIHQIEKKNSYQNSSYREWHIKKKIKNHIETTIKESDESAVLLALTIGDKSKLSKEIKNHYKNSGAMHMLALSGLHIGIIYSIISNILMFLNLNYRGRYIRLLITIIIITIYTIITGGSASVLRASIMICLYNIAKFTTKKVNKFNILLLSALLIILYRPNDLFTISFQLSFAAMIGIIYIYPILSESFLLLSSKYSNKKRIRIFSLKILKFIWNTIAISVSCQISTIPISYYYFKYLPDNYLVTNLMIAPLLPIIMYLFPISIATNNIPFIGDYINAILNSSVFLLNKLIIFNSNNFVI